MVCQKQHAPLISKGRYDLCSVLSWRSATIKRVVRSTLAAEGYAISEAAEQAQLLKQVLEECQRPPGVRLAEVEKSADADVNIVYTDSGFQAGTVNKDSGRCADKRFKIVVSMLRQTFEPGKSQLKWVSTKQMLADGLTKCLNPQLALMAIMMGQSYDIPEGRAGQGISLRAALMASRLLHGRDEYGKPA